MMAHNSHPERPRLDAATVDQLSASLEAYLEGSESESLRIALRHVAIEARAKSMHAEDLLIALKDCWYGLPAMRGGMEGEEHQRMLQRAVTLCIREYYST